MFKNSCIVTFLLWLNAALKDSYIFGLIEKIIDSVADCFSKSRFKKILANGGEAEDFYNSSFFARIAAAVSNFFSTPAKALAKLFSDSAFSKLISSSHILKNIFSLPFLCCVMFIIPHDYWNNLFALAIAVLVLAVSIAANKEKTLPPVWFTMIVFMITTAFSVISSYDTADSIRTFIFFVTAYMLCIAVYIYISDTDRLKKFLRWMLCTATITSIVAYAQRALGIDASVEYTDLALNEGMPGRAFSTLGNPNNFAEFLILFMPFGFAYAITRSDKKQKLLCIACIIISVGAVILTYSRSGWIALALAVVVYVMLYNKKYLPYLVIAALVLIPFLPQSVINRILTIGNTADTSSSYRLHIWTGCFAMLSDYWLTGVGLGSGGFQAIFPPYSIMSTSAAPHSHMQFLEMFLELGILGFIAYVCFMFVILRRSFAASKTADKFLKHSAIASAAAMTGIILIGFFEYCWFYPRVLFAFFICAGVCMASVRLSKKI